MVDIPRRGTSIPMLIVLLLVPLAVQAQDPHEVEAYLISVSRLYEDLEYERALEQIDRAKRMTRGVEADVAIVLYEGIILADMGRLEGQGGPLPAPGVDAARAGVTQGVAALRVCSRGGEARPGLDAREARGTAEAGGGGRFAGGGVRGATGHRARGRGVRTRPLALPRAHPRHRRRRAAGGGGVSSGLAKSEQSKLRGDDSGFVTREDARASASRGRTYQTVGLGLVGAGVVRLGVATGLYLLGAPAEPLALGVSTDGTSAFVYGSWR